MRQIKLEATREDDRELAKAVFDARDGSTHVRVRIEPLKRILIDIVRLIDLHEGKIDLNEKISQEV